MSLKNILQKIKEHEELIAIEPDPYSPAYPAQQANRRNAMVAIKDLQDEYKRELIDSTLLIVAYGKNSSEFSEKAEQLGTYTGSLDAPMELAVESTNSELFVNKQMNQESLSFTIDVLENIISNAGVSGLSLDYMINSDFVKSKEQYMEFVAGKLAEEDKSIALFFTAMDQLSKKALKDGFDQKVFPVLLTTKYEFLADSLKKSEYFQSLLPYSLSVVSLGKKTPLADFSSSGLDEDSVKEVFSQIKYKVLGIQPKKSKTKKIADTEETETAEQGE